MASFHPSGEAGSLQTPVFILSSGRTGSTFLARLLRAHPRLLCVSDLFEPVGEVPYFDRATCVSGERFFEYLSAHSHPLRIAYWRRQPTDELLYLPEKDDMVSLLLTYTLPFLSADPMALYHRVAAAVRRFPPRSPADQLTAFFDFLRDSQGKQLWVERTGGSLPHARRMVATWPDGKFVYNVRDPRETAISMMTGSFFRLYLALTRNPGLQEWDGRAMPHPADMGAMLESWICEADGAWESIPRGNRHLLRYEDLMNRPEEVLLGLVRFLFEREPDKEDRDWAARQARKVKPAPLRFGELSRSDRGALAAACRNAVELLGYAPAKVGSG